MSKRLIKRSAEVATTWLSLSLTLTRLYALVIRSAVIAYPSFWLPPSLVRLSDFLNLAQNLRPGDKPLADDAEIDLFEPVHHFLRHRGDKSAAGNKKCLRSNVFNDLYDLFYTGQT